MQASSPWMRCSMAALRRRTGRTPPTPDADRDEPTLCKVCLSLSLYAGCVGARYTSRDIVPKDLSRGSGPHLGLGASRERRAQERGVKAMSNLGSARRTPRGHTRTLLNILTCMCNTRYRDTATPPGQRGYQMSRLTAESMACHVLWPAVGSPDGRAEARLLRHRSGCLGLGLARGRGTGGG